MATTDLSVFRDEHYPTSWISNEAGHPDRIASFLRNKGLTVLNARELRRFMVGSIVQGNAHEKLVVFSQDILPTELIEDYSTSTTFREYLDAGGSVLWMGDVPLIYLGKGNREIIQAAGLPLFVLGIMPLFAETPKQTVRITKKGKSLGLKHRWSGRRPILKDSGIKVLAVSESVVSALYVRDIPEVPLGWRRLTSKLSRVKTMAEVGPFKVEVSPPPSPDEEESTSLYRKIFHKKSVNAWIRSYNQDHPDCGFVRIWDYAPRHFTDDLLEELYDIIKHVS